MEKHSIYKQLWFPLSLELLATAVFVLTVWTAQTTHSTSVTIAGFKVDASSTLTLLSVSQGVLSSLITAILSSLFEAMQWTLTARENGLTSISLLGISPTTGVIGCLRIILSRRCRLAERLWPLLR